MGERLWKALDNDPLNAPDEVYESISKLVVNEKAGKKISSWWKPLWEWLVAVMGMGPVNFPPKALDLFEVALTAFHQPQNWSKRDSKELDLEIFVIFVTIFTNTVWESIDKERHSHLVLLLHQFNERNYMNKAQYRWCQGGLLIHKWLCQIVSRVDPQAYLALISLGLQLKLEVKVHLRILSQYWRQAIRDGKRQVEVDSVKEYLKLCQEHVDMDFLDVVFELLNKDSIFELILLLPLESARIHSWLLRLGYKRSKLAKWNETDVLFRTALNGQSTSAADFDAVIGVYLKAGKKPEALSWALLLLEKNPEKQQKYASLIWSLMGDVDNFSWDSVTPISLKIILDVLPTVKLSQNAVTKLSSTTFNIEVLRAKHQYFLKNYRQAPVHALAEEADSMSKAHPDFREFACIWSMALDRPTTCSSPSCFCSIDQREFDYACERYTTLSSQFSEAQKTGRRVGALNAAHEMLKLLEEKLKNLSADEHNFVTDSTFTHHIVIALQQLSTMYILLGVLKPAKAYLEQILTISKSIWPMRKSFWSSFEVKLESLDTAASNGHANESAVLNIVEKPIISRPFMYEGSESEDLLDRLFTILQYHSPHSFTRMTHRVIMLQQVSIDYALGLLTISSALPFVRRDQAEQRDDNLELIIPNWREYVLDAGRSQAVVQIDCDFESSALIIANYETRQLLVIPASDVSERLNQLNSILARNKESLFGHKNKNIDVADPAFKRSWWKTRLELDAELASLALYSTKCDDKVEEKMQSALKDNFSIDSRALSRFLFAFGSAPKATVLEKLLCFFPEGTNRAVGIKKLRACYTAASSEQNIFLDEPDESSVPGQIVLVLDKNLHIFPWEATQTLKGVRVYRQPSFWHLWRQQQALQSERQSIAYVLNPGGDLKNTEAFFRERLDGSWRGIVGRPPAEHEFLEAIRSSKLFLYFGHGGGDSYCSRSRIRRLQVEAGESAPPALLIGCSSGSLKALGPFCPEATFLDYMYAGCPTILVNLWDVTDKDIDKFSDNMLQELGAYGNENLSPELNTRHDLSAAVSLSRPVCLMKHLNGAAPVVYGLPFYWDHQ